MTQDTSIDRPRRVRAYGILCAGLLALALIAGCATGRAVRQASDAERSGDWDTAVAFYREALGRSPGRMDLRIKLERATRMAAVEHVTRARQLEAQDQLAAAIAEYRLAADLDASNVLAAQKATELERRLRAQVEAARPRSAVETLREQAGQLSSIPRLDPRAPVPEMRFQGSALRDILRTISDLTGINISYAQDGQLDALLSRPYTIQIQETPLEEVLNQILQENGLLFKVQNARTIFVYQDNQANRQKYEDQYLDTFYLSSLEPTELIAQLTQLLSGVQTGVRPVFTPNVANRSITVKASVSILDVVERFIRANDRPPPEVLIEAEILEVDRAYLRQLGLELNQWALNFTLSPEVAPSADGTPPFNLNTISRGVSASDFYVASPSALIRLLESNQNTRTLSKPSSRTTSGQQVVLTMGQRVPIPQTVFQTAGIGGLNNIPTTSVSYEPVGVNLTFTPTVTYQDEVVLSNLVLEKSGLSGNLETGGQSFPVITNRRSSSTVRLRDGESTIIAGLLLDEERDTIRSLPGLSSLPILRSIFGNSERRVDQTDIIMIITPRIIRGHGLTAEDLKRVYVGTGQNMSTGAPPLLSPEALGLTAPTAPAPAGLPPEPAPAPAATPAPIVPIQPVETAPNNQARVIVSAPSTGPDGALLAGGGPHTMPIQIAGVTNLATLSLTITYDPAVIKTPTATLGSFMSQAGVSSTFVPRIDGALGRIDLAFTRPTAGPGASGSGLLAAIAFVAGEAGTTAVNITGVGTTATGQVVPIQFTAARVTVK